MTTKRANTQDTDPKNTDQHVHVGLIEIKEKTIFSIEKHEWGQFVYSAKGMVELTVKNNLLTAPPEFGVWLPPDTEHLAWVADHSEYYLINIDANSCTKLPNHAAIVSVSNICKAILADLKSRKVETPGTAEDIRLMHVLVDQLGDAASIENFLPSSNDPMLKKILEKLFSDPADNRSLLEWSLFVGCTERTLARKFDRELNMSLAKWKQRLRLSRALKMLSDGMTVQAVSQSLGYSTPSAFITMFQKAMGTTPNNLRSNSSGRLHS
ncbi:AraC family transcriptional regulator [Pseudomonas fulva]|uniref:AraC family transcriptional regulator n=1 Tax=Pseudomonas fulva TaxID=47880 RepID=UPI0018AC4657|nr:AraC family transcriptional regulator [Pseudomonas fulva]MBF8774040.1 helix-turn-helix domain-containing protein [Pseudomonas fulva]